MNDDSMNEFNFSADVKPKRGFAPPGQGLTFWTIFYGALGLYGLIVGLRQGSATLLVPGSVFALSSLGIWFGSSAARWLLFSFLSLMCCISIFLMATKGVQATKVLTVLATISCCFQLYLWNPSLRGRESKS